MLLLEFPNNDNNSNIIMIIVVKNSNIGRICTDRDTGKKNGDRNTHIIVIWQVVFLG